MCAFWDKADIWMRSGLANGAVTMKAAIPIVMAYSSKISCRLRAYSEVVADQRKTRKPRSEDLGRGRGQPLKGGDRERGEQYDIDEQHAVKWGENLVADVPTQHRDETSAEGHVREMRKNRNDRVCRRPQG